MAIDWAAFLALQYGENTMAQYLFALGIILFSWCALYVFRVVIVRHLEALSKKTKTDIDDLVISIIKQVGWPFYFFLSLAVGFRFISQPEFLKTATTKVAFIVVAYYAVKASMGFIEYAKDKIVESRKKDGNGEDTTVIDLLSKIVKAAVWIVAVLVIFSNMGYNVSALMAGLGVGGIAIAFALQNVLSDIFASFSIYFDKPFQVGDYIVVGTDMGTVEKIGIKSTRIRSSQGEEMIISNKELTEARVRNFKKLERRRVTLKIGVTYETGATKLKKVPEIIRKIFEKVDACDLDRVHFAEFTDSAIMYEIVYFVNSNEFTVHMDKRQEINLAIYEEFKKEKIDMAHPTRTVYMHKK